jgi:hypothetical protein
MLEHYVTLGGVMNQSTRTGPPCPTCGEHTEAPQWWTPGRARKYCSPACRQKAYRGRVQEREGRRWYLCPCGCGYGARTILEFFSGAGTDRFGNHMHPAPTTRSA